MWDHVPDEAVEQCQAVLAIAEPVLTRLFTPDHLTSARRMTMDLAGTHTQQFLRGRPDVWAAAITYAVAQVHSAFDSMSRLFGFGKKLTPQQLIDAFPTVSKAAMTSKATMVRDWLDADGRGRRRYNRVAASAARTRFPNTEDDPAHRHRDRARHCCRGDPGRRVRSNPVPRRRHPPTASWRKWWRFLRLRERRSTTSTWPGGPRSWAWTNSFSGARNLAE